MATDATIRRVARPRGEVTPEQAQRLDLALGDAELAKNKAREVVLAVMAEGASFSEVSKATGLSTATLQRWKREASS